MRLLHTMLRVGNLEESQVLLRAVGDEVSFARKIIRGKPFLLSGHGEESDLILSRN